MRNCSEAGSLHMGIVGVFTTRVSPSLFSLPQPGGTQRDLLVRGASNCKGVSCWLAIRWADREAGREAGRQAGRQSVWLLKRQAGRRAADGHAFLRLVGRQVQLSCMIVLGCNHACNMQHRHLRFMRSYITRSALVTLSDVSLTPESCRAFTRYQTLCKPPSRCTVLQSPSPSVHPHTPAAVTVLLRCLKSTPAAVTVLLRCLESTPAAVTVLLRRLESTPAAVTVLPVCCT